MNDYEKYKDTLVKDKKLKPTDQKAFDEKFDKYLTPPRSDNFAVVSPCFYEENTEMVNNSKQLFESEGVTYITYGSGEQFTNKVYTNLIRLYAKLEEIEHQYPIVAVIDAEDTLYLGGGTILTLLNKYRIMQKTSPVVVFASENKCYPAGSDIFYLAYLQERYLNSGIIMGSTNLIKVMIREMIKDYDLQRFEFSNDGLNHSQIYWHRYFNEGKPRRNIHVDQKNEFFYCMDSCDPYLELEIINRLKIKVKATGTYPKVFHFNRCFNTEYKYLFGEFWIESLNRLGI